MNDQGPQVKQFNKVAGLYAQVLPAYPRQVYMEIPARNQGMRFQQAVDIGNGASHFTIGLELICNDTVGVALQSGIGDT